MLVDAQRLRAGALGALNALRDHAARGREWARASDIADSRAALGALDTWRARAAARRTRRRHNGLARVFASRTLLHATMFSWWRLAAGEAARAVRDDKAAARRALRALRARVARARASRTRAH